MPPTPSYPYPNALPSLIPNTLIRTQPPYHPTSSLSPPQPSAPNTIYDQEVLIDKKKEKEKKRKKKRKEKEKEKKVTYS